MQFVIVLLEKSFIWTSTTDDRILTNLRINIDTEVQ